jgi:predicted methyltransferase
MSTRRVLAVFLTISSGFLFAACSKQGEAPATVASQPTATATDSAIVAAVNAPSRTEADKSRDKYRHPSESLAFWGLKPGMSILEVQPGAGWWTEILAPYAKATNGQFYVTGADTSNPQMSDAAREARAQFEAKFVKQAETYGSVQMVNFSARTPALPAEQFDFILTSRSVHGWMGAGVADSVFKSFAGALKPGGILAVEQHRANPGEQDPKAESGYVTEAHVVQLAEQAGLELVERSEINANPADTKDHPFGVWTLPPTARTRPFSEGNELNPSFDRTKYDAIGESDRMTLKFRKAEAKS